MAHGHAELMPQLALIFMVQCISCVEWEITGEQIEICLRSDGSEWVLGEGSYGTVVKAMKGGVQVGI